MSRQMGYMGGVAAASSVTQASLKILLHKRFKGPDAEDVSKALLLCCCCKPGVYSKPCT